MEPQAILFDIHKWTTTDARKWLTEHGYTRLKPVHKTKEYLRYRLKDPKKYKRFITKRMKTITFVFGIN